MGTAAEDLEKLQRAGGNMPLSGVGVWRFKRWVLWRGVNKEVTVSVTCNGGGGEGERSGRIRE